MYYHVKNVECRIWANSVSACQFWWMRLGTAEVEAISMIYWLVTVSLPYFYHVYSGKVPVVTYALDTCIYLYSTLSELGCYFSLNRQLFLRYSSIFNIQFSVQYFLIELRLEQKLFMSTLLLPQSTKFFFFFFFALHAPWAAEHLLER